MHEYTKQPRKVPYGIANYAELRGDNCYFVDKTRYIAMLERIKNPIFLRPRRFGKSLLCSMLRYYYDLTEADRFDELFGHTWIGRHPTPLHNQCLLLSLDFSTVYVGRDLASIEQSFQRQNSMLLAMLRPWYAPLLDDMPEMVDEAPVADNLRRLLAFIEKNNLPPVYVNMRTIFVEYFNELHGIDVSTRYAEIMRQFVTDLDLISLFAGYWREHVSQLPETVFQQMNENFYRISFYELCRRYLSRWFTWNVERSAPQGRSDLEFVSKYHEKFAGLRYVIEFKYFSNAALKEFQTTIEDFPLQQEDTRQIAGYTEGLQQEYPEARISQFVIYCFGNQGFRVFEV